MATKPNSSDLISWWELNDTDWLDSHSTNHLKQAGAVGIDTGVVGNGAEFSASTNNYLYCCDSPDFDFHAGRTMTLFFRGAGYASAFELMGKKDAGDDFLLMSPSTNNTRLSLRVYDSNGTASTNIADVALGSNASYFATMYITASDHGLSINDGVMYTTPKITGEGSADLRIGGSYGASFAGVIDNVNLWYGRLSSDNRAWIYNDGSGRSYSEVGSTDVPVVITDNAIFFAIGI